MDRRFVEGVLLRCLIYGFGFLLFWAAIFMAGEATDHWTYDIHSALCDITEHDFILMNYLGMNFLKVILIVGFLIPYVAVRFAGKDQKSAD